MGRIRRYTLSLLLIIAILLLLAVLLLQTSFVQQKITDSILSKLSKDYNATWQIGNIDIDFFDELTAKNVLFLDQNKDTLLATDELQVDIGFFNLLIKELHIDKISFKGLKSHIYALDDKESFNYSFLSKSTNQEAEEEDANPSEKGWNFSLKNLSISDLDFSYKTPSLRLDILQQQADIKIKNIDLDSLDIHITSLMFDNGNIDIQTYENAEEEVKSPYIPDLGAGIRIENISLDNQHGSYRTDTDSFNDVDLALKAQRVYLNDMVLDAEINSSEINVPGYLNKASLSTLLNIKERSIKLDQLSYKSADDLISADQLILDLQNEVELESTHLNARLSPSSIRLFEAYIPKTLKIDATARLNLKSTQLNYKNEDFISTDLYVKYGNTLDINTAKLEYSKQKELRLITDRLKIDLQKISKLIPAIKIPDEYLAYKYATVQGSINGTTEKFILEKINVQIDEALEAKLSGQILHADQTEKLSYTLDVENLMTHSKSIFPDSLDNINLWSLGAIKYKGELSGDNNKLIINGLLDSEIGILKPDLIIGFPEEMQALSYTGDLATESFDLGTFLYRTDLGKATFNSSIKGKGSSIDDLEVDIDATLSSLEYNNYTYTNAIVNANISDGQILTDVNINDPNVHLKTQGTIDINKTPYALNLTTEIDTILPKALGFTSEDIKFSGTADIKMDLPLSNGASSFLLIKDYNIDRDRNPFHGDSLLIHLNKENDTSYLNIDSEFAKMQAQGIYEAALLYDGFLQTINYYYPLQETESQKDVSGFINGSLEIIDTKALDILLKDKYIFTNQANMKFNADFATKNIEALITVDSLVLDNYHADSISTVITTSDGKLFVSTRAKETYLNSRIMLQDIVYNHEIYDGEILSRFSTGQDAITNPALFFSTLLSSQQNKSKLTIRDSFYFNNTNWIVNPKNSIAIEKGKIIIDNLDISDSEQTLSVLSQDSIGSDYSINFTNFDLNSLAQIVYDDSIQISGLINGNFDIKGLQEKLFFLIALDVDNIIYEGNEVGNLAIRATENPLDGTINSEIILTGRNSLNGKGIYDPASAYIDMEIDIKTLEARLLDLFLYGTISNTEGLLAGEITARGYNDQLRIKGDILTKDLATTIVANNTSYNFGEQYLQFNENIIDIGEVKIEDKEKNTATVKGLIFHDFFNDFVLDLTVLTDKFLFLNSTSKENPVLFGDVYLGADISVYGPLELMQVDAIAETQANTKVTLSPFSETESILKEEFIIYGNPETYALENANNFVNNARKYPFDVNLLLQANEEANMRIIVDPITQDKIDVKGSGNLRANISPDGKQEIFGLYSIESGTYSFSYGDFVSKNFTINPGSNVKFVGDPLSAQLNITAVYKVYTSTYELIKNQVTLDDNELTTSKNRTNVNVYLTLQGNLDAPEISLDIRIDDDNSGTVLAAVDRKLADLRNNPNELNNQVFGLLLFNSFILTNNNSTGLNNVGAGIALNSISELISSQLNNLASNAIKGVDISFDVNSYNSQYINEGEGGNVTELGLTVSKQLFSDRLSVKAGGNINLEEQGGTSKYSSIIGDFVLEYKLTEKGNYRVRVFSKSNYDRLLNENSNKNGVSLYFNKSFDSKTGKKLDE